MYGYHAPSGYAGRHSDWNTNAYYYVPSEGFAGHYFAVPLKSPTGLARGCYPTGNSYSSVSQGEGAQRSRNASANYGSNGGTRGDYSKINAKEKFNQRRHSDCFTERICGPRADKDILSPQYEDILSCQIHRNKYNLPDFQTMYDRAKFFTIKSYNEDDVHKSIKYNVWASTAGGNKRLNAAFWDAVKQYGTRCPIFLFFSVNSSGKYLGVAEMLGPVDFRQRMNFWREERWSGVFSLKWHIVKDVPYVKFRSILLQNNDNRPVYFSRDTQQIPFAQGLKMLDIFKSYAAESSILEDFGFYNHRENLLRAKRTQFHENPLQQTDVSLSSAMMPTRSTEWPDEVLMEVLSRLPAKEVCRLRCLCKSANAVVDDFFFRTLQSSRSVHDCGVLISYRYGNTKSVDFSCIDIHSGIPSNSLDGLTSSNILGCSGGLIVYQEYSMFDDGFSKPIMCIRNPVTMKEHRIRLSECEGYRLSRAGAVVVSNSKVHGHQSNYKLFCWELANSLNYLYVYCFGEGCWKPRKTVNCGRNLIKNESHVVLDSTIYLVSLFGSFDKANPYIVAIDVEDETTKILPLPQFVDKAKLDQIDIAMWWDGRRSLSSLCAIRWWAAKTLFQIWVLEDREKWIWSENYIEVKMTPRSLSKGIINFTLVNANMLIVNVTKSIRPVNKLNTLDVYKLIYEERRIEQMKTEVFSGCDFKFFRYANTFRIC